jgi:predicted DNA-binding transcriptional regulator YafY
MAKYKPQHSRLLFIDREINTGRFPNCRKLAEEYEVSTKTIQRDLGYMRYQLDAPLEYSAKHRGYYYTEKNYKLPAIDLKESDLFAVYLADKLLIQYEGTAIYNNLCSVFKKIEDSLPHKITLDPGNEPSRFTVFPPSNTIIKPGIWETVTNAIRLSRKLRVEYQTPGSKPSKRILDPYHGVRFEGDWYVVAFCHLRKEIRTFSLARMLKAELLPDTFKIPVNFNFHKLSGSHFGIHWSDDEVEVKIHFNKTVAGYLKERKWHPTQQIEENPDGSTILSLKVNHLLELKRWILSWGDMAQVLEPQSFRENIKQTIDEMKNIYFV